MVRPALLAGYFGTSYTRFVAGLQYHLGGAQDTRELAAMAGISASDHVLDVCCFIGGPAFQLADSIGCRVTGVDISESAIAAADRIARLAGLSGLVGFQVADAAGLPYPDQTFTVVWNQASLEHNAAWLREFDRVLQPGGRMALTFQLLGGHAEKVGGPFSRWKLRDVAAIVEGLGYRVEHAQDITERDIEIGWKELDRTLSREEGRFADALGQEWVQRARREFMGEIEAMRKGRWGNGRLVATKR